MSETDETSSEEGVVCTVCLEINGPEANYCPKCGAPVNSLLSFNPWDQTLVEGFAYRRAVDGPPSKIILIGIWMLFSPSVLFFALGGDPSGLGLPVAMASIFPIFSAIILYRATANYLAKRKRREGEDIPQED